MSSMTATAVSTEQNPVKDNPKENLARWCMRVGLNVNSFVEYPDAPGFFTAAPRLTAHLCKSIMQTSEENRGRNRKLRPAHLSALGFAISSGKLMLTGQTIIVSDNWTVLDGHHRLTAGSMSENSFPAAIVFGTPENLRSVIDNAVGRSLADGMQLAGQGRYGWLAQAINLLITRERTISEIAPEGDPLGRLPVPISPTDREEYLLAHPDLATARDAALQIGQEQEDISLPELTYALYLAQQVNPDKARAFVGEMVSGAFPDASDPRLAFTKWAKKAAEKRAVKKGPKKGEVLKATLKVMKFYLKGLPMAELTVSKKESLATLE